MIVTSNEGTVKKEITTVSLRGNREYVKDLAILALTYDVKVADIVRYGIDIATGQLDTLPEDFFAWNERQIEQPTDETIIQPS
jgi:hypothetical protein